MLRRFQIAALIGGVFGFVLLLHLAAEKAGAFGWKDFQFPNVVLLPVTELKVCQLIDTGRTLIFRREILEHGFEFSIRGAGAGVIGLLLFNELVKRFKIPCSTSPFFISVSSKGKSSRLAEFAWTALFVLALLSLFPLFICLLRATYYLIGECLHATTVAILLPSIVLNCLIIAAACKKKLFLWQVMHERFVTCGPVKLVYVALLLQLAVVLASPLIACGVFELFSHQWGGICEYATKANQSFTSYRELFCTEAFKTFVSAWITGLVVFVINLFAFRLVSGKPLKAIVLTSSSTALFSVWCLHWLLPAIELFWLSPSVEQLSKRQLAADVYSLCSALSTIPSSLMGLAVAFSVSSNSRTFIALRKFYENI